jgi:hypothetical protein
MQQVQQQQQKKGTPTASVTDKMKPFVKTSTEFKVECQEIARLVEGIFKIGGFVARLSKGDVGYEVSVDGQSSVFTRADYKNLITQLKDKILGLPKIFKESLRATKKGPSRAYKFGTGLTGPIRANQNLVDFFSRANLGYLDPTNSASGGLNAIGRSGVNNLLLISNGITTRSILTALFNLYNAVNGLQQGSVIVPDDLMRQYLGQTLADLQVEDQLVGQRYDKKGKPMAAFNANGFTHKSITKIIKPNVLGPLPKAEISDQLLVALENEQRVISCNNYYYKSRNDIGNSPHLTDEVKNAKILELNNNFTQCRAGQVKPKDRGMKISTKR